MKNILLVGGTSEIALEVISLYKNKDIKLYVLTRNKNIFHNKLLSLGIVFENVVKVYETKNQDLKNFMNKISSLKPKVFFNEIFFAQGYMETQYSDLISNIETIYKVNLLDIIKLTEFFISNKFYNINKSKFIYFSSVAGDRVRIDNFHYGLSKFFLNTYVLNLCLFNKVLGLSFCLIKPGPTKTNMTLSLNNKIHLESPKKVAKKIFNDLNKGKKIIYSPSKWNLIMLIIKLIPNFIFKRINFRR